MNLRPLMTAVTTALCAVTVWASTAQIRLTPDAIASVADQRSTITVTALVLTPGGSPVPDGTQVVFSSTHGTFRDEVIQTIQGRARAVLIAPGTPGTATITARSYSPAATTTCEIEFFSDRSLLSAAREYVEVFSPGTMVYSPERTILTASAPGKGVRLRYRDIEIDADDLQLMVPTMEVRAKRAELRIGKEIFEVGELYFKLAARRGTAFTRYRGPVVTGVRPLPNWIGAITEEKELYGDAEITSSGTRPLSPSSPVPDYTFLDTSESASLIQAKRVVAFPRREIQFQDAQMIVGGVKVVRLPLYKAPVYSGAQLVTDQIININDNTLAVNYPHYLSLKPGLTSLLRFRTGESYGRGLGASTGAFLDYELSWNRGDDFDGGLVVSGIARRDYSVALRQAIRFSDDTQLNAAVEVPAGKSFFGNVNLRRPFRGFDVNILGSTTRTLSGARFEQQLLSLTADTNPVRAGRLPLRVSFGVGATSSSFTSDFMSSKQQSVGLSLNGRLIQQNIDKVTNLNGDFRLTRNLQGNAKPLALRGSLLLSRQLSSVSGLQLQYDYLNDGFGSRFLGTHRLGLRANYNANGLDLGFSASRSLDVERLDYMADLSYRFSPQWRFSYQHTFSQYLGLNDFDYVPTLWYNLGGRDFGLSWSSRTRRLGIQLFGAGLR